MNKREYTAREEEDIFRAVESMLDTPMHLRSMTNFQKSLPNMGDDGLYARIRKWARGNSILTTLIITTPPMAAMFFQGTVGQFAAYNTIGAFAGGAAGANSAMRPGPGGQMVPASGHPNFEGPRGERPTHDLNAGGSGHRGVQGFENRAVLPSSGAAQPQGGIRTDGGSRVVSAPPPPPSTT